MNNYASRNWNTEGRFLFPEYKHNTVMALVGWSATSRHLAPYNTPGIDLMGLNEASHYDWFKGGATAWMQIHPRWDYMRAHNRNDPTHYDWLKTEHGHPIFMQDYFYDIPDSVRYPIEEAYDLSHGYLTSSFSYMMALAVLMGYERIEVYGFDMAHDSEYGDQKPAAEYLIGKAEGLGIEVYLPPKCPLLRGNLYAYEDLRAADHTYFILRKDALEKELERGLAYVNYKKGQVEQVQAQIQDESTPAEIKPYLAKKFVERNNELVDAQTEAASIGGQVDELRALIAWHESQNVPADRKGGDPNEQAK